MRLAELDSNAWAAIATELRTIADEIVVDDGPNGVGPSQADTLAMETYMLVESASALAELCSITDPRGSYSALLTLTARINEMLVVKLAETLGST